MNRSDSDISVNGNVESKADTKAYGVLLIMASVVVGLLTVYYLVSGAISIYQELNSLDLKTGSASSYGRMTALLFFTAIGSMVSIAFYAGSRQFMDPARHSGAGKLQQIARATREISLDGVDSTGFYSNASDHELMMFFHQLREKESGREKLLQLVIEVRKRVDGLER